MKILLTEGAGLTSRQVATQLDARGHQVWAATSDPWCLARFTRHVHHLLPVPAYGPDPLGWFDQMLVGAVAAGVEVVFPTQEQVAALSHQLPRLTGAGIATAVPSFAALRRVQDKCAARRTLEGSGVPQPRTVVVQDPAEVEGWDAFPAFVKAPVGTGSSGVRRVANGAELRRAVAGYLAEGAGDGGGVLVQAEVVGTFVMAQCVFDGGRMVAFHVNQRVREGANGSAAVKCSTAQTGLQADLARLGSDLHWHGALSVDAIVADGQSHVIDVNPRLVEPGNALAAGTDLVGALLAVALGTRVPVTPPSRPGVRTHQLLMAILGAAQHGRRRQVVRTVVEGVRHRGDFLGSREELQPSRGDWRCLVLPLVATVATVLRPASCRGFTDGAVSRYALTAAGYRALSRSAPLEQVSPTAS